MFTHRERGATLVETVVAAGIVVVAVGISVPLAITGRHEQSAIDAARFVSGRIMLARATAAQRGAAVGLRFEDGANGVAFRSYVDMNGNGVRTSDITSGVDLPIDTETRLADHFNGVRFELSPAAPPIGAATPAGTGADAVQLGAGDILSVSPFGTATSGTLYLRSRAGHQSAVRILGATARVQVHQFDFRAGSWRLR